MTVEGHSKTDLTLVQYGCGLCAPNSWVNYDVSPTLRLQHIPLLGSFVPGPRFPKNARYGDITRGLPMSDGSADAAYCSHTLEHLSLSDFRAAIRNTYKLLRPGGVFRFVLPDLRSRAEQYLNSDDKLASMHFMEGTMLGMKTRPQGVNGLVRSAFGNAKHLWMWDYAAMECELDEAGFTAIRRASFGDSSYPFFKEVESEERWTNELGVECARPA